MHVKSHFWFLATILLTTGPATGAQQPTKISRIGFLTANSLTAIAARVEAFQDALRELGYIEGKNLIVDWRYAEGKLDRLPAFAVELVGLKVDAIVTAGSSATGPAKEATTTIPIVMAQDGDPVANGFVASLARPGGNITGFSTFGPELSGKLVLASPVALSQRPQILDLTVKSGLPAIYPMSEFVEDGGLMSYAPNYADMFRRAAMYVDKILKGAKPADLPVEQPKKFEFIVNLKTAKQIGVTIPPNVLVRADRVIR